MGGISTLSTREQLQINRKLQYDENEGQVREGEGINCSESWSVGPKNSRAGVSRMISGTWPICPLWSA